MTDDCLSAFPFPFLYVLRSVDGVTNGKHENFLLLTKSSLTEYKPFS